MKNLSNVVGLDILLKRISGYAESNPGKNAIINLKPTIPNKERLLSFKRLREIQQILHLVPSLNILKKNTVPEKGKILTGEQILHYKKLLELTSEVKNIFTENWTDKNGTTRAPIAPSKDFALFYNPRSVLLGVKLEF